MTIPEPTNYDQLVSLKSMYEKISDAKPTAYVPASRETALAVISRAYHAERERDALRAKLHDSDRIGTHYDGCWDSGRRHYACAVAEIAKLRARVAELEYHLKTLNAAIDIAHPHIARMIYKRSSQLKAKGVAGE